MDNEMSDWKRWLYGIPLLAGYRNLRTRQLSRAFRPHPAGFQFAGGDHFFRDDWEAKQRRAIAQALDHADIFIDIGANQGIYSCLAAKAGKTVVALEPEPGNLNFLRANAAINRYPIEILPLAASDAIGSADLFGDSETASLLEGWYSHAKSFRQKVEMDTLDNLFGDRWIGQRLLIKIDVEGFEGDVMVGAPRLLRREPHPVWIVETYPTMLSNDELNPSFDRLFRLFFDAGYEAMRIDTSAVVGEKEVAAMKAEPTSAGLGYFQFRHRDA